MSYEVTANNTIWLPLIEEFVYYIKNTYEFEYNDIEDVERTIDNFSATPKDGLKYFVKCDDDENILNTIYQFDTEGVELFSYSPVYKDRIIFNNTDEEIPNYIFIYKTMSNRTLEALTEEQKAELVMQREENTKYNNSKLGAKGITEFIGYSETNLYQSPTVNFLYENEKNVTAYNKATQPNGLKDFNLTMLTLTSNEVLYESETPYNRFFELECAILELWGDYMSFCSYGIQKDRIVGTLPCSGEMINETSYLPAILHKISMNIEYR